MTVISASAVKELREMTGAGMMDCKKALAENGGDKEAAVDWLRKKGLSKAAKKSDRVAAEGVVAVAVRNNKAVIAEVNSETDFVARNENFQELVSNILNAALENDFSDAEALKNVDNGKGQTVNEGVTEAVASIGENIMLRRAAAMSGSVLSAYVHNKITDNSGKIGVLVALNGADNQEEAAAAARQIAMHVAAASPLALRAEEIPQSVIERERAVHTEQAKESGKPDNIIAGMVEGKMKKFFKESCLLEQPFIMNPDQSVADFVKTLGAGAEISGFIAYRLGEGVEKQSSDFAAEVAAAIGS